MPLPAAAEPPVPSLGTLLEHLGPLKGNGLAFHILYHDIKFSHFHLNVIPKTAPKCLAFVPYDVKENGFLGYILYTCLILAFSYS